MNGFERHYFRSAYRYSSLFSDDPRTENGACIVPAIGIEKSLGANRFPLGVMKTAERLEDKLKWIIHAEADAIFRSAKVGRVLAGAPMYCPWAACSECAKA